MADPGAGDRGSRPSEFGEELARRLDFALAQQNHLVERVARIEVRLVMVTGDGTATNPGVDKRVVVLEQFRERDAITIQDLRRWVVGGVLGAGSLVEALHQLGLLGHHG